MRALLVFLMVAIPSGLPAVDMAAEVEGTSLTVRIAAGQERQAFVVVAHDDPLVGEVVDRLVPVGIAPNVSLELNIDGLRPDAAFSVRLVDHVGPGETLDQSLSRVIAAPVSVSADVGNLTALGTPRPPLAYPTHVPGDGRLLATPTGALALVHTQVVPEGSMSRVAVALSHDGGHRFGQPIPLGTHMALGPGSAMDWFPPAVIAPDGRVVVLTTATQDGVLTAWTVSFVDAITGHVEQRGGNASLAHLAPDRAFVRPDGSAFVVGHADDGSSSGPRIWRLLGQGAQQEVDLETVRGVRRTSDWIDVAVGGDGSTTVFWHVRGNGTSGHTTRYATSQDTQAWLAPANLTLADDTRIRGATVDRLGITHALVSVGPQDPEARVAYVRLLPGTPPQAVWLDEAVAWQRGPIEMVINPALASQGGRVWIVAAVAAAQDIVRQGSGGAVKGHVMMWESVDAGQSFAPGYELVIEDRHAWPTGSPAIMPDGRPVLLSRRAELEAIPVFDPFPEPACASRDAPQGAPPTVSPALADACGERLSLDVIPGDVRILSFPHDPPRTQATPDWRLPDALPAPGIAAGAAGAAGMAWVAWRAGPAALGLLGGRLFSRVLDAPLDHPVRAAMLGVIQRRPGATLRDVCLALRVGRSRACYHVTVLQKAGLVTGRPVQGRRRYFAADARPPRGTGPDAVLACVRAHPGSGASQVGRALGVSRQAAFYHLRRLERTGQVRSDDRGGYHPRG